MLRLHAVWQRIPEAPDELALLAAAVFCGASILWITVFDMRARGTSGRMRPIRVFDLAVGLALLVPSLYALTLIWPELRI